MTALPPPPPSSPGDRQSWPAPIPGSAGQIAPPPAPDSTSPAATHEAAGPASGRRRVVEAHMAARRVPARWEELRDQQASGQRAPAHRLALIGLALSLFALVAGGVLLARGAGSVDSRIAADVAVGTTQTVQLDPGQYDVVVQGSGLFRSSGGRATRTGPLTTAVAFEPPTLRVVGAAGEVALVRATGERGGRGEHQRALVYRVVIAAGGEYAISVGAWEELRPRIRSVLVGETPLLRQPNVWSGIVMLVVGFVGIVITLLSMSFGALAGRRRRRPT